jgi:hypothetical protein
MTLEARVLTRPPIFFERARGGCDEGGTGNVLVRYKQVGAAAREEES